MSEKQESNTPSDAATCSDVKPRRRVEMEIQSGADNIAELVRALEQISFDVDRGTRCVVSGGPCAGWHFKVDEDDPITHDSYFAAVDVHLRRQNSVLTHQSATKDTDGL
jgi:hypothetical protein